METPLFKIVFKGEIGFDYDQDEVKANLHRQCGFSQEVVEKLFSGGSFVLKKDIDEATAHKFRESLQRLGALCEVAPMIAPAPIEMPKPPEALKVGPAEAPAAGEFNCPACRCAQRKGDTCIACGVVFAKFERVQTRRAQVELAAFAPAPEEPRTHFQGVPPGARRGATASSDPQTCLLHTACLFLGLAVLQTLLAKGLTALGFILLPVGLLLYLLYLAMSSGADFAEVFEEAFTLLSPAGDNRPRLPYATYVLVGLYLLFYYLLIPFLDPGVLVGSLTFLPTEQEVWSLPLSLFASLFLHADGWQLWGSVLLLWAVGSVVETRIGVLRFLICFFLGGLLASGTGAFAHQLILGAPLHAVGSSGAIAGLVGMFVACCCYRTMVFDLPLVGVASLFTAVIPRVSLNALVVIGVFVYANLYGAFDSANAMLTAVVGHLAHLGGFVVGLIFGLFLDPATLADASGEQGPMLRRPPSVGIDRRQG